MLISKLLRVISMVVPAVLLRCILITCVAILLLHTESFGQASELKVQATALQSAVVNVQSGAKTYEQKITFQEPALIRYSYDEIDQKGNRVNYVHEFNLADIDPYTVREETQKDLISVVIGVRNKQKLVKVFKNDEVQPYDDETAIMAKDIENARAISEIIKKAIPPAEKIMASRLKLSGYDAMLTWLCGHVKDVSLGAKSFKQALSKGEKPGSVTLAVVEADAKTSAEEVYSFNLSDINANAVTYKITGNQFAISLEVMHDAKYIGVRKNGETRPFVNEVIIRTNNADEARDLRNIFTSVVPLAAEKVKAAMPVVSSEEAGRKHVHALTAEVSYGEELVSQSFDGGCLTSFTQLEKDPRKNVKNVYKFNWMDVNPLRSKVDISGERLFIDLIFNEDKKLVMHTVDDKFKGYDNSLKLFMADIENARTVKFAMDVMIEKCKAAYKEPFGSDVLSTTAFIRNNIKEVALDEVTLKQTLESVEDDPAKLRYTVTEAGSKGAGASQVYEFSLSDINPLSIAALVKGKWLYVSMETDLKARIIKYYKDGKVQPYASGLEFAVNDVEVSRNLVRALIKAVNAVKAKGG